MIKTADAEEDQLKLRNTVSAANLSHSVKEIDIPSKRDKDGAVDMMASAVFPVDPNTNPILNRMPCVLQDGLSPTVLASVTGFLGSGYYSGSGANQLAVAGPMLLYRPSMGVIYEAERTPEVFKNVQTAAVGSTAIWTAGVGKKWRLMGGVITLGIGTTAAAGCDVSLLDVAADIGIGIGICTGAMAAVPNSVIVLQFDIKNGILAAATNTALNVTLSSAMAVNGVSVQVWGTEE